MWSGAVLVLLAMLTIGVYEFREERQVARVLDILGINLDTGAGDGATVSASAAGPAAPMTPPSRDAGAAKPVPTEPTAADSPAGATAPASPASAPIAADAGAAKPMSTEPTAADSPAGATAPASPASTPIAADAGAAKPMSTEPTAADSPAGATAPASHASPNRATQPPAPNPPPMRVTQQHASPAPANPREACGARTQFSLYRCMQMQCSQRRWASHAQCEHLRVTDSVD